MQSADFDRKINLPTSGGKYFRLKAKGDKIKFLIANTPSYETVHWISEKESVLCDKYNGQDKSAQCEWCEKYKSAVSMAGEDKRSLLDANKLKAKTNFFYQVLNLQTDESVIFQTTPSVHWTIVGYKEEGVDVFACAWSVERTEEAGKYYEVRRLDTVKLTKAQKEVLDDIKNSAFDKGKQSKTIVVGDEDIDPDTVNF